VRYFGEKETKASIVAITAIVPIARKVTPGPSLAFPLRMQLFPTSARAIPKGDQVMRIPQTYVTPAAIAGVRFFA
jgi:hypothetical protein